MNRGFDSLKVVRKGGKKGSLAIHPQAAQRIRDYLALAKHGEDIEGPLFRPVRDNRKGLEARRPLHPDVIDRTLRKYARHIGLERGYSAHSMRATFITTALDNGASLEGTITGSFNELTMQNGIALTSEQQLSLIAQ